VSKAEDSVANGRVARGWERKKANRDTYQEILQAAGKAFSSNGYEGSSLSDIAREVGIKTPALYYHFKSKKDILFAYLEQIALRLDNALDEELEQAGNDPKERLYTYVSVYISRHLQMADTMPTVNTIIFSSSLERALDPEQVTFIRDWERSVLERLRKILRAGKRSGDFDYDNLTTTTFYLMGAIDFVVNWYKPEGGLTIDEVAGKYARLALSTVTAD